MSPLPDEKVTQDQYIERWEQALRVLESMDEHTRTKHFRMHSWGRETDCGTVACVAGHCTLDSWFRQRGFGSRIGEDGQLDFTDKYPAEFFGFEGETRVFLKLSATYEQTVANTKNHIEYLKGGGRP